MTVFKFLFVLALAVPLAVFMWNYINKLSDEFQKSVSRSRGSRRPEQPANLTGRRDRKDLIQRKLLQERCKSLRANGSGARHAKKIENFETGRPENEQRLLYIL